MNLKATLKKADMTAYRLAKEIDRNNQQIYKYVNGQKMSPLMEEKIRTYFEDNGIEIVD
jgi:plasmid maintenance system antidote protein VapI